MRDANVAVPLRVALTGGIACGKSTAGRMLAEHGVAVCDADEIARELLAPGTPYTRRVIERFGPSIVDAAGAIDRRALGRRVFMDAAERAALEAIVHPETLRRLGAWLDEQRRMGRSAAAIVPLLFEVGATVGWDAVICVTADMAVVRRRLAERGLTPDEAERRVAAQWSLAEKARRADYVIENNGTLDELRRAVEQTWQMISKKERGNHG